MVPYETPVFRGRPAIGRKRTADLGENVCAQRTMHYFLYPGKILTLFIQFGLFACYFSGKLV